MPYKDPKKQREAIEKWRRKYPEKHNKRVKNYLIKNPWTKHLIYARQRCNNPNNTGYKDYGLRGIECLLTTEEIKFLWFRDKAWLLNKPSIDRENNNGHYTLENCQFIEMIDNVKKQDRSKFNKAILQYDLKGKLIKEWHSMTEASKGLNTSASNISGVLRNKQKTAKGFIWSYKDVKN